MEKGKNLKKKLALVYLKNLKLKIGTFLPLSILVYLFMSFGSLEMVTCLLVEL